MIVPARRLLVLTGIVFAGCALAYAVAPEAAGLWAAVAVVFVLFVLTDAALSLPRTVDLAVEAPAETHMTSGRAGELRFTLHDPRGRTRRFAAGVALPPSFYSEDEFVHLRKSREAVQAVLPWRCTPQARGEYEVGGVFLGAPSLLGLWELRRRFEVHTRLRVYPSLDAEQRQLSSFLLHRDRFGIKRTRMVGKGREFERLRDYLPGDPYEDISWKATARRGHPVTRVYQVEHSQQVYVCIDGSRLSARRVPELQGPNGKEPPPPVTQLDRFIRAALMLARVAEMQEDQFGMLTFDDRVTGFVRAGHGRTHYAACRDLLYKAKPNLVNPDFGEAAAYIRTHLRRRALLIFLSNLDDPLMAESFQKNVQLLAREHVVLAMMIAPPQLKPLFAQPAGSVAEIYDHLAGHLLWQDMRQLQRNLQHRGVQFLTVDHAALTPRLVSSYLEVKQRQLL